MQADFIVIIPARYGSTRLPGKPLKKIGKKTLIEHAYKSAIKSHASKVYVATDDERIVKEVVGFDGIAVMTGTNLNSGTDRVYEAAVNLKIPENQIIVNVPVDEFQLDPDLINQAANTLAADDTASMATLCEPVRSHEELRDRNTVKVVLDAQGFALYFSRSVIPWLDECPEKPGIKLDQLGLKHLGVYTYRKKFLGIYSKLSMPDIEIQESLEQLRALFNGYKILVKQVSNEKGIQINTEIDLKMARRSVEVN